MNGHRMYLLAIAGSAILTVVGISNGLAGPARITPSASAHNQAQPFHAEITAELSGTLTPSSNPCVDYRVASGSGFIDTGADPINVSSEAIDELLVRPRCQLVAPPHLGEETGFHFFTAPNGDQLVAHANSTGIRQPDGTIIFSGTFHFSGGTGQFAGAHGDGTITVTVPPTSTVATIVYDGKITLQSTPNNRN